MRAVAKEELMNKNKTGHIGYERDEAADTL